MNNRMKELDSVRGIAVLLVIAFHTLKRSVDFTPLPLVHFAAYLTSVGWIGVDIFFALSGFLITNILLRTREHPHYFKNFYARRALRILPVYFFLVVAVVAFAPNLEKKFVEEMPAILLTMMVFQQNWAAIFFYFPVTIYLAITWSLAIEEQFYFIWPLVVRRVKRETMLKAGLVYITLSILARVVGVMFFDKVGKVSVYQFFYFASLTRFEELLIGAMLALLLTYTDWREKIKRYSIPVFLISFSSFFALVIVSPVPSAPIFGYIPITIFGYTLIALFTAGLIAAFSTYPETALIRRLFQNRLLEFFGQYSYSMYLFHPPVMLISLDILWHARLRGAEIAALHVLITFAGTTLLALLTWNLIEKRALSLKKYFEY